LVISDAHEGLRQAIAKVLHEACWQRCRVHFMRNLLSVVPKQAQDTVAAIVRTIFSSPDHASAMTQLHEVARMLEERFPQAAELLEDASEDLLAHLHFPREHRRRLHSTNPLERLHKEVKRRTRVVGIFPTRDSLMRMVGTLLAEQDDVRVGMMADSPGMPPTTMCPPVEGVAFHLSGSSGSLRRAMSLDRSSSLGVNARMRTA
jgi:putative transposase